MSQAKIKKIRVGVASCGVAAGADAVLELLRSRSESVPVEGTGCLGHCYAEPMVEVVLDGGNSVFYRNVKAENGYIDNILSLGEKDRFEIPPGAQGEGADQGSGAGRADRPDPLRGLRRERRL